MEAPFFLPPLRGGPAAILCSAPRLAGAGNVIGACGANDCSGCLRAFFFFAGKKQKHPCRIASGPPGTRCCVYRDNYIKISGFSFSIISKDLREISWFLFLLPLTLYPSGVIIPKLIFIG